MKLSSNIAFNQINENEIKVLKLDDDNNVYTLEKSVAHVFELISKEKSTQEINSDIKSKLPSKSENEVSAFVKDTIEEFKKLGFFE